MEPTIRIKFLRQSIKQVGTYVRFSFRCALRTLLIDQIVRSFIHGIHVQALSDGALEINVGVVSSIDATSDHIAKHGTNHTEAVVTESQTAAERFVVPSDCAAVMVNSLTRFTDGEQMGFGAEIGISNQKLHARGPMGLEAMTTTIWIVTGEGQIRT